MGRASCRRGTLCCRAAGQTAHMMQLCTPVAGLTAAIRDPLRPPVTHVRPRSGCRWLHCTATLVIHARLAACRRLLIAYGPHVFRGMQGMHDAGRAGGQCWLRVPLIPTQHRPSIQTAELDDTVMLSSLVGYGAVICAEVQRRRCLHSASEHLRRTHNADTASR